MANEAKPMDLEQLDFLLLSMEDVWYATGAVPIARVRELLADRDYWKSQLAERTAERKQALVAVAAVRVRLREAEEVASVAIRRLNDECEKSRLLGSVARGYLDQWNASRERAERAEAEVKSWRDRCPVTAEDVERAGIDDKQVDSWLCARGWSVIYRDHRYVVTDGSIVAGRRYTLDFCAARLSIANLINRIAQNDQIAAHDILDEMAGMEVSDGE